jgi:hypothetical protein
MNIETPNPQHNLQAELDALVVKAREQIENWHKGDKTEQDGKAAKKKAVIEYGKLLLEGQSKHLSTNAFGQWVKDNKLNKPPYADASERSKAMQIAELDLGSATQVSFDACPVTTPSNMMKWAREKGLIKPKPKSAPPSQPAAQPASAPMPRPATQPPAPKRDLAREAVRDKFDSGQSINRRELGAQLGVSGQSIITGELMERGRKEALDEIEEALTDKQKNKLAVFEQRIIARNGQAVIEYTKKINSEYEAHVREGIQAWVAKHLAPREEEAKKQEAYYRKQYETYRKAYAELYPKYFAIFTIEEFNAILRCLHTDTAKSVSNKDRDNSFRVFMSKRLRLTGKK